MEQTVYQQYLSLLRQELIPAMGCTEPIALAYCAAATWDAAGGGGPELADRVEVTVSGNIIKNVKSVIVPNTGGLRGIETAVAAGLVSGRREKRLEVLAALEPEHHDQIRALLDRRIIRVLPDLGHGTRSEKYAANVAAICTLKQIEAELDKLPRVSGSREADKFYITQGVDDVLQLAERLAASMKDEYVSVEHLLLATLWPPCW